MTALALCVATPRAHAQEGVGRAGLKETRTVEVESEFYAGRRGYLHGAIGVITPLAQTQTLGVSAHFVREQSGGEFFPSLGAEFVQEFGAGFKLEAFSFGYFPVEQQSAWAVGVRGGRAFTLDDDVTISPFFGPTFARVRAIEEAIDVPRSITHLMLLAGVEVEAGPAVLSVFGSQSFFSRDPVGLETRVDLEEMTHFAAYENNDGFARTTGGAECSYAFTPWLGLAARYAFIRYDDARRHAVALAPAVKFGEHFETFAGVQLLRGDGPDNDLLMTGVTVSF